MIRTIIDQGASQSVAAIIYEQGKKGVQCCTLQPRGLAWVK